MNGTIPDPHKHLCIQVWMITAGLILLWGFLAAFCGGCNSPMVETSRTYYIVIEQYGAEGNSVNADVLKDQQLTPTVNAIKK